MRWLLLILVCLLLLLQYPLWVGRGGWLNAWETDRALAEQLEHNQRQEQRNAALEAEVRDLKSGLDAVEERARFELGLTKPGEVFVQIPTDQPAPLSTTPPPEIPTPVDAGKKASSPAKGTAAARKPAQPAAAAGKN